MSIPRLAAYFCPGHSMRSIRLFDNQDLCFMLKVSVKTLQRYRKKGILPYLLLDGKYYYRASDIHRLIRERTD